MVFLVIMQFPQDGNGEAGASPFFYWIKKTLHGHLFVALTGRIIYHTIKNVVWILLYFCER